MNQPFSHPISSSYLLFTFAFLLLPFCHSSLAYTTSPTIIYRSLLANGNRLITPAISPLSALGVWNALDGQPCDYNKRKINFQLPAFQDRRSGKQEESSSKRGMNNLSGGDDESGGSDPMERMANGGNDGNWNGDWRPTPSCTPKPQTPNCTPQQQTSGPTPQQRPSRTPQQTPGPTPQQRPSRTPQQTPGPTPQQRPSRTPQQTPGPTPQQRPSRTPQQTPGPTPQQRPSRTPQKTPDPTSSDVGVATGAQTGDGDVSSTNIGVIIGATVGGIAGLVLIVFIGVVAARRRVTHSAPEIDLAETEGLPSYLDSVIGQGSSATRDVV